MKRFFILLLILPFLFFGCGKDNTTAVPLVAVNLQIYTSNPEYLALNAVGGWVYISGGSRGIIVYKESSNSFKAYDRHCTFQPDNACGLVSVDDTNIAAEDDCCNSKFILTSGGVLQGPAVAPLKEYRTSFDGSVLRIFN